MSYNGPYNRGDKSEADYLDRSNHTGTQPLNTISGVGTMAAESADDYVPQTGATGAAQLPVGTTAQRPTTPLEGMLRRNAETGNLEEYTGTSWEVVGSGAGGGATGGGDDEIFILNDQVVTSDYTIVSTRNAGTFGPITINDNVTVTIEDGATWTIV